VPAAWAVASRSAFAYAGHAVTMIDAKEGRSTAEFTQLETDALDEVRRTFISLSRFGLLKETEAETLMARVSVVPASAGATALASAGMVFEGVPEVVELKRLVLGLASKAVGPRRDHCLHDVDHPGR